MNKTPVIKHSTQTLTRAARDLFEQVGIRRTRLAGQKVYITQSCLLGVSFLFAQDKEPAKEYHIPHRMVSDCFN